MNAVAPGFIDTDMTQSLPEKVVEATLAQIPLGKFGEPEQVAKAVAFLASEDASYITGQCRRRHGNVESDAGEGVQKRWQIIKS